MKMSAVALLGRALSLFWSLFNPNAGHDGALLFFIEENVKPRDTGTLFAVCAGEVLFEVRNLELFNTNSDSVRHRLRRHARKMRACQFEIVAFKNVSPPICSAKLGMNLATCKCRLKALPSNPSIP
jgi:hypothetical protein